MLVFISKYRNIIILACFCAISLILSWMYNTGYEGDQLRFAEMQENPVKKNLSVLLIPNLYIEQVVSFGIHGLADIGGFLKGLFQKPAQLDKIQALENRIEGLKRQLDEERSKNKRLEKLWHFSSSLIESNPSYRLVPANVIAVEPTDWFRYLTIDKGRDNGLKPDMAVITEAVYPFPESEVTEEHLTGVVVGKIETVYANSARVQLITDRLSSVAVTIDPLKDLVLLKGQPHKENCSIDGIPSTTHDLLNVGNAIIIDERSSIFPPGMLVGWISSIERETQFCQIEVEPAFRFSRLKEVIVVLDR